MSNCTDIVRKALGEEDFSEMDADRVISRMDAIRKRVIAEGSLDDLEAKVKQAVAEQIELDKLKAVQAKREAVINTLRFEQRRAHVDQLRRGGVPAAKAVLALMENSLREVFAGRVSAYTNKLYLENKYTVGSLAKLSERPHIMPLLSDKAFNNDIVREMYELREGGTPGKTGNDDAAFAARVFLSSFEVSRREHNRMGGYIGKLDGFTGSQAYDADLMLKAGKKEVVKFLFERLDTKRSFPDAMSDAEVIHILEGVYDNIVLDRPGTGGESPFAGTANLAKASARQRVLHYKDADAWIQVNEKYGRGEFYSGFLDHQRRMASTNAQFALFGTNPENMLSKIVDHAVKSVENDAKLTDKQKAKEIAELQFSGTTGYGGKLTNAFLEMQGVLNSAKNRTIADVANGIKAWQLASKMTGSLLSSVFGDPITQGAASMSRGQGFMRGVMRSYAGLFEGKPKGEQMRLAMLVGEGFDGANSYATRQLLGADGMKGWSAWAVEKVFKWGGQTWFTDRMRSAAGRMLAADLGHIKDQNWSEIHAGQRAIFEQNGWTEAKWNVIRNGWMELDGKRYITADQMQNLDDAQIEPLIAGRLAEAAERIKDPAKLEKAKARLIRDMKSELEFDVGRYMADETNAHVIETDAMTRRMVTMGTRPGTPLGEALRMIMMFKSYPVGYMSRLTRYGFMAASSDKALAGSAQRTLGMMIAGMTIGGYMAMAAKDFTRGQWPPRDPTDPKVWMAAIVQGGGLGLFGDFLFGELSRFGAGPVTSQFGPVVGEVDSLLKAFYAVRNGEAKGAEWLNIALQNTPFLNMWYVRPALNALIINHMREALSPGYRRRREQRLRKQGQELLF